VKAAPRNIETARLYGTAIGTGDLDYMVSMDTDPQVSKALFGIQTRDQSRTRLEKWIAHGDQHGFGFWIFRDGSGEEIGHAGLFQSPRNVGSVEVGYALRPEYWYRGFATEMTRAAILTGFTVLQLPRIIGIAVSDNLPSRRVLEKLGLEFESEYADQHGGVSVLYSVDRKTWLRRASKAHRWAHRLR